MNGPAWNPFREIEALLERYSQSTGRAISDSSDELSMPDWSPFTDVEETGDRYVIRAELPGVRKQDIVVCFADSTLVIRGEKHAEIKSEEDQRRHRSECFFGNFCRTFRLPESIDTAATTASYNDGVLTVWIPKTMGDHEHEQLVKIS